MPVVLASFKAVPYQQRVLLQWTFSGMQAGSPQQLERSADGQHFSTLTQQSSTAGTANYSYTDTKPGTDNYYRIRYSNGSQLVYSDVRYVHFPGSTASKELLALSPNPASTKLQIEVNDATAVPAVVLLKSIDGSTLKSIPVTGSLETVDVSDLSTGVYVICLVTRDSMISKQFEKL